MIKDGLTHMSGGKQAVSKRYEANGPHASQQPAGWPGFNDVAADFKEQQERKPQSPLRPRLKT